MSWSSVPVNRNQPSIIGGGHDICSWESVLGWLKTAASVIVSEHIAANLKKEKSTIFVHYGLLQMLVPVPVRAELAPAPALDRAGEVADQAREWEWAKRPVRRRLGNTGVQTLTPSVDAGSIAQMTGTPFLFSLSDLYCTIFAFKTYVVPLDTVSKGLIVGVSFFRNRYTEAKL